MYPTSITRNEANDFLEVKNDLTIQGSGMTVMKKMEGEGIVVDEALIG